MNVCKSRLSRITPLLWSHGLTIAGKVQYSACSGMSAILLELNFQKKETKITLTIWKRQKFTLFLLLVLSDSFSSRHSEGLRLGSCLIKYESKVNCPQNEDKIKLFYFFQGTVVKSPTLEYTGKNRKLYIHLRRSAGFSLVWRHKNVSPEKRKKQTLDEIASRLRPH